MSDDENPKQDLRDELKALCESEERRGYPSYWHADRCSQTPMEVDATRIWAGEMNQRSRAIDIGSINKNDKAFPDCIAQEDGRRIGVEVTEFTVDEKDRKRYAAGKKDGQTHVLRAPYGSRDDQAIARSARNRPKTRVPNAADWPLSRFRHKLEDMVRQKDQKAEGHGKRCDLDHFDWLVLLIVTDESNLWMERLSDHLGEVELPRPQHFHAIYMMMSYQPGGPAGDSGHPLFEVRTRNTSWKS